MNSNKLSDKLWAYCKWSVQKILKRTKTKCEKIKSFKIGKNEVKLWFTNNYKIRNRKEKTKSKNRNTRSLPCSRRSTWKKNLSKRSKIQNLWKRRKLDCLTYNIWWSFGLTRGNFYINFWSRFIIFVFTHFERFVRFSFKESQMSWQNWSNMWITRNSLELSPKTKLWKKSLIWREIYVSFLFQNSRFWHFLGLALFSLRFNLLL